MVLSDEDRKALTNKSKKLAKLTLIVNRLRSYDQIPDYKPVLAVSLDRKFLPEEFEVHFHKFLRYDYETRRHRIFNYEYLVKMIMKHNEDLRTTIYKPKRRRIYNYKPSLRKFMLVTEKSNEYDDILFKWKILLISEANRLIEKWKEAGLVAILEDCGIHKPKICLTLEEFRLYKDSRTNFGNLYMGNLFRNHVNSFSEKVRAHLKSQIKEIEETYRSGLRQLP